MHLHLTREATEFLSVARPYLAADPVLTTVVATVAHRAAAESAGGLAQPPDDWWATITDGAEVVGVAMRTAPFVPRPAYLLAMPDAAALLLARTLHERGEDVDAANGAPHTTRVFLDEVARLTGRRVALTQRTRLFELDTLVPPRSAPGRLRAARTDEVDLVHDLFGAFGGDADEQAGRERGAGAHEAPSTEDLRRRIASGRVWLWQDAAGQVVHLTGINAPAFGVTRIGPVYTPVAHRGRGWASNAVAEVSRRVVDQGARACLFTDQANPTSNTI